MHELLPLSDERRWSLDPRFCSRCQVVHVMPEDYEAAMRDLRETGSVGVVTVNGTVRFCRAPSLSTDEV